MRFFLLLLLAACLLHSSCKPDSDAPCRAPYTDPVGFTNDELIRFPYAQSNDTLGYISSNGDSLLCTGTGRIITYRSFGVKNNPECPDDSIGYSIYSFNFHDSLYRFDLTVSAHKYDSTLLVQANATQFSLPLYSIGVNDSLTYFDSIAFGNKMFMQVNAYTNANGDSLYYNTAYGVVACRQGAQRFYIYRFNNR